MSTNYEGKRLSPASHDDPAESEQVQEKSRTSYLTSLPGIKPLVAVVRSIVGRSEQRAGPARGTTATMPSGLSLGADGQLKFLNDTKPDQVLIVVYEPFNSEDMIRTALDTLQGTDIHVHILWVTDSPTWAGFSFNSGLVQENLRFIRQRGVARLEHLTGILEEEGYSATWEAEESDDREAQIVRSARELGTDLLAIPAPAGLGFLVQRRLTVLAESVGQPMLAIGPDRELYLIDVPASNQTERSSRRIAPQRADANEQKRPVRERLSARVLDS